MRIVKLSKKRLDETVEMFEKVFPGVKWPRISMEVTLGIVNPKSIKGISGGKNRLFWIALEDKKVIGAIGIYDYSEDTNEARWINWFGVEPNYRRQGVGRKLLAFAIDKIKKENLKFARLWTSADDLEKNAQYLYESLGLLIPKNPKRLMKICKEDGPEIIVREKKL